MDFSELLNITEKVDVFSGMFVYVLAGIGVLLAILALVWLLMKLSSFISRKSKGLSKEEPSDEEQLFGD